MTSFDPRIADLGDGSFRLGEDLERLAELRLERTPEAVVFHCGRVLEVLTSAAAKVVTGEGAPNAFSNLRRLDEVGLLDDVSGKLFHTLRRLGNDVRHVLRKVNADDGVIALALLERFLDWYFSELGPELGEQERAQLRDLLVSAQSNLFAVLAALQARPTNFEALEAHWNQDPSRAFRRSPALPALYGELLMSSTEHKARTLPVVEMALTWFPGDARLRQLHGWALRSRSLDDSLAVLEQLNEEHPKDPETLGLMAGTLKQMWRDDARWGAATRQRRAMLQRLTETYYKAWTYSREADTYTGINAASMALLLGDAKRSQSIARAIVASYEKRRGRRAPGHAIAFKDYFDQVTLAEAELLGGEVAAARKHYRDANRLHSDKSEHIVIAKRQLELVLPALGHDPNVEAFLAQEPEPHPTRRTMTYEPKPIETTDIEIDDDLRELTELLAEHVHDLWAQQRIADGWRYGPQRNDGEKTHPDLVPYAELPDGEKEYDRKSAIGTLKAILAMGYRIRRGGG